ncbi:uncharacterized protein LOC111673805 [Seriola lalandi dorsalis]|nr:uncharacterized protein LOC111673805 [Seriola lalandi dorsalis]
MDKKDCSASQSWDSLLKMCVSGKTDPTNKTACSAGQMLDKHSNKCVSSKTETGVKKICSAGQTWDELIGTCLHSKTETRPEPERPTEPPLQADVNQVRVIAPVPQADPMLMLSPALWIFVVLATMGSILALALWFIIYRRETRQGSTSEDAEPGLEPLQKTIHPPPSERNGQAQMFQRAAEAPWSCPHLHLGAQTGSKWEDCSGIIACRGLAKHAGKEAGEGLPACSRMRGHKIPLPATELGGTALVTTKTV